MGRVRTILTIVMATVCAGVAAVANTTVPSEANVEVALYSGYTPETYLADGLTQSGAHESLVASATTAALAGDFAEANGGDGGSGPPSCSLTTYKPRGNLDTSTSTVYVEVTADVWCNFTSPEIVMKVILQGHEGGRSVNQPSSDVTCPGAATCAATAYYSSRLFCGDNFHFEHYGRPYGSYKLKNGTWKTLVGNGVAGPISSGGAYRYC